MKPRLLISLSLMLILLSACATTMLFVGQKYSKYGSSVEVIENGARTRVEYESYDYMVNDLQEKAKVKMWTQDKIDNEITRLPKGGYILVHVSGITIDAANTKWWEYIVQTMDGKEILRKRGDNDIPEYSTSQYGTTWWNIDGFSLPVDVGDTFKVYVIDNLSNKRSGFIVYPNMANR